MRRERRGVNNTDVKRVLYIVGGVLSLAVIAFVTLFILYGTGSEEQTQIAKFNTTVVEEYNNDDYTNSTEEASTQIGKTVNEVQENSAGENEVKDEEEKQTYAVNTSNKEEQTETQEQEENTESQEKDTTTEQEKVKDPEFHKPVEGEILRAYAKDNLVYSATLDEWVTHNGIDIVAEKTTVVKASAEGTVKSIKNDPRYGLTVVIEHVNGFTTVYSNLLTAEFIEEGEKVEQGQTIGTVGNTATFEIADEPHLHFEIQKDSQSVDPELYLKD